jgi:hypothetical protein
MYKQFTQIFSVFIRKYVILFQLHSVCLYNQYIVTEVRVPFCGNVSTCMHVQHS